MAVLTRTKRFWYYSIKTQRFDSMIVDCLFFDFFREIRQFFPKRKRNVSEALRPGGFFLVTARKVHLWEKSRKYLISWFRWNLVKKYPAIWWRPCNFCNLRGSSLDPPTLPTAVTLAYAVGSPGIPLLPHYLPSQVPPKPLVSTPHTFPASNSVRVSEEKLPALRKLLSSLLPSFWAAAANPLLSYDLVQLTPLIQLLRSFVVHCSRALEEPPPLYT